MIFMVTLILPFEIFWCLVKLILVVKKDGELEKEEWKKLILGGVEENVVKRVK